MPTRPDGETLHVDASGLLMRTGLGIELDLELRSIATKHEITVLEEWQEHGSISRAAKATGRSKSCYKEAKAKLLRRAARAGYILPESSAFHMKSRVPVGFVLKGQSAYVDADGRILQRWDKTKHAGVPADEAVQLPDPKRLTKLSTMRDGDGNVIVQWQSEKPDDGVRERAWRTFAEEIARDLPRVTPTRAPRDGIDELLAGYPIGDHHLGMYAWNEETLGADYDLDKAEHLLMGAVDHLTQAMPPARRAVIAALGDLFHYDGLEAVTPRNRNLLDSDGRYAKIIRVGMRVLRYVVDAVLRRHAEVLIIFEPGNHDPSTSLFMQVAFAALFENEARVTVDTSPARFHYFRHGQCLVGTHHGDLAKLKDLPLIMATDRPEEWGQTRHRFWWTGHVHTDNAIEYNGCRCESFQVLPPTDAWASGQGYRAGRGMKAIVLHAEHGEVARHAVNPGMLLY